MTKKNFLILILIFTTASLLIWSFIFIKNKNNDNSAKEGVLTGFKDFVLFDRKPNPEKDIQTINLGSSQETGTNSELTDNQNQKLKKISDLETAGFIILEKESSDNTFSTTIHYIEKNTGYIYEYSVENNFSKKISSNYIPNIYESFWGQNGEFLIFRYLKNNPNDIGNKIIESFLVKLSGIDFENPTDFKGSFLPSNIESISVSPDKNKFFYLLPSTTGVMGTIYDFKTNQKNQIFTSEFGSWLPDWSNQNRIFLNTKPSFSVPGYLYYINTSGGNLNKVLGGINGLTSLVSPDGKKVIFSGNDLNLKIYNLESREVVDAGLRSLPEKCLWSKDSKNIFCAIPDEIISSEYPDIWYQGISSFNDRIWKINLEQNTSQVINDPIRDLGFGLDFINIKSNEKETFLTLVDKKENTLWILDLK